MRILISSLVMVAGCGIGDSTEPTGQIESAVTCPDPDQCVRNNGGGVYTEELGFAGIGSDQFMIMRFINRTGGGVDIKGRYFDGNFWRYDTTPVLKALYFGQAYTPVSVAETGTDPTWTLLPSGSQQPITVSGFDLVNLQLLYKRAGDIFLSFSDPTPEPHGNVTVWTYKMQWRSGTGPVTNYCFDSKGAIDPVVFQAVIGVNPVDAQVVRDADFVTLSCRLGAPATARSWGYKYRGGTTETDLFDAALPMKRASYCGDDSFYTRKGTFIGIWDDLHHNVSASTDPPLDSGGDPTEIEAAWGKAAGPNGPLRMRAICVNGPNLRRLPTADYPDGSGQIFNSASRDCPDGYHISTCSSITRLVSQKAQ